MLKASELRGLSSEQLDEMETNLRKELFLIVSNWKSSKKLEAPHLARQKRKDRARILTILREKQLSSVEG